MELSNHVPPMLPTLGIIIGLLLFRLHVWLACETRADRRKRKRKGAKDRRRNCLL
jgi:hypothetical protein